MKATIIVSVIIAVCIIAAAVKIIRDRKKGKSSCSGNCVSCPMAGKCHQSE